MPLFDEQAARQDALLRQLQGLVRGARRLEVGSATVATPAMAAGAVGFVTVPHSLGVVPSGGIALAAIGGTLGFNVSVETWNGPAATSTTAQFAIRNSTGGAVGASNMLIVYIMWGQ